MRWDSWVGLGLYSLYISLTMQRNSTAVTTFEPHMDEEVDNDNKVYKWYERSMGRMVHGTNGLHVVRIVRGTNSQWYEKSRHRLSYASFAVSPQRSRAVDFQLASLRPCLWRTHQPSLAAKSLCIRSKVAVLVYKVLHGCAPSYLGLFTYVADLPSSRGLRSSCSDCLFQSPVHRSTVGSRSFSVADLPHSTQDVPVYWIISWHSADLTFCFYTLSIVDLAMF